MSDEPPLCSACGQVLTKKGKHKRHLLMPVAGSDKEEYERWTVLLPRFLCKCCSNTHVGFPEEGIIPYKHYGEGDLQGVAEALEALEDTSCAGAEEKEAEEALHPLF